MKTARLVLFITLAMLWISPVPKVNAHKISVFAYESNGEITTEAKFNSGRPAQNAAVFVQTEEGVELQQGTTDENGIYRFKIPVDEVNKKADIKITVDLGDGHMGYWVLEAMDYLEPQPASVPTPAPAPVLPLSAEKSQPQNASPQCADTLAQIQRIVATEIEPIKRQLASEQNKKVSLQDILGGLGYIIGLAGAAAYAQSKKSGGKK